MSEENVEIVRKAYENWNRGDHEEASESVAPEIVLESNLSDVAGGTYEGIAGLQQYLAGFWGNFVDFHTEIEDCIAEGDEVVISAHHYGRGRSSGVEVEGRNWHVVTVRGGKIVRFRLFRTKPEALEAAGLSE